MQIYERLYLCKTVLVDLCSQDVSATEPEVEDMSGQNKSPILWKRGADGVVTLVLDAPGARVNTITTGYIEALSLAVDRLEREQDTIQGVIIRSAKESFLAGGDLNRLMNVDPESVDDFTTDLDRRKSYSRRLELLRCPVVAIINGPVLGGGLELALCTHRSIAIDDPRAVAGFPEASLGLLPGAGGIVRMVHRLGLERALDEVIIPATKFTLREAVEIGLIDEVVESPETAERVAREWMNANYSLPHRSTRATDSSIRELPSPQAISTARAIAAVGNIAVTRSFDEALHAESVALSALASTDSTKNTIRMNFFATNDLRKAARKASDSPKAELIIEPAGPRKASLAVDFARHRSISLADPFGESESAVGPDARIVNGALPRSEWTQLWFVGDTVGDRLQVVEYSNPDSADEVSALARAGLLPVLAASGGPLSRVMTETLEATVAEHLSNGVHAEKIAGALRWVGLKSVAQNTPTPGLTAECDTGLVCEILDQLAEAGRRHLGAVGSDMRNVVSVRAGGFPSWTGGIYRWHDAGRELVAKLVENDVAMTIEEK